MYECELMANLWENINTVCMLEVYLLLATIFAKTEDCIFQIVSFFRHKNLTFEKYFN